MLALALSLQLLFPAPVQGSLDLVPPLRLELPGSATSGFDPVPPAAPMEFEDPHAGRLVFSEFAAAAAGVLVADVASGIAGGAAALIVGASMVAADVDGLAALAAGLVAAGITTPLVNLALTPLGAVLGARLVDLDHPFADRRGIGTPLIAAYGMKLVEAVFFAGAMVLIGFNVHFAELSLIPFLAVHFVGVPYVAAYAMHAQTQQAPLRPPPSPTIQPDAIPPPPPPPPQMGRRFVVPLIATTF